MTFEIRLMRKHDLTNIYFSLFVDNFLTILTIQRQSWRLATLETLITILTIENLNSDHLWDLAIKSDAGQHLQFLQCLYNQPIYLKDKNSDLYCFCLDLSLNMFRMKMFACLGQFSPSYQNQWMSMFALPTYRFGAARITL